MAEPGSTVTWAERMENLRDSAQLRVLAAPMPRAAMDQLLADGKAQALGNFEGSPVHYLGRWWRAGDLVWVALDETASAQLDLQAERYRAATSTSGDATFGILPRTNGGELSAASPAEGGE
ncbi:hypothetical protein [Streptomyces solaniscabiei]|uniref:hypothetical protein n=1 Tax=Streptomyces solaniscabiei TaxID=2683255 RepID=UPI001CE2ADE1|nr:hypothetical protein [Streptomyces solaniscabiei]